MAREKFCPRCGEDITDSYEPHGPDIMGTVSDGSWYCDACELPVPEENYQGDD